MSYWKDLSLIYYSPYYTALSDKQHGSGIISEFEFLNEKISIGNEILDCLGGGDEDYLKLLFTADSLATAAFGIGGRKVLIEKYNFDKRAVTIKIIKGMKLSEVVFAGLFEEPQSFEPAVIHLFNELLPLGEIDTLTAELKEDIKNSVLGNESNLDKTIEALLAKTPRREAQINAQEADMRYAIDFLERDGISGGDLLMFLLGAKERDLQKKQL